MCIVDSSKLNRFQDAATYPDEHVNLRLRRLWVHERKGWRFEVLFRLLREANICCQQHLTSQPASSSALSHGISSNRLEGSSRKGEEIKPTGGKTNQSKRYDRTEWPHIKPHLVWLCICIIVASFAFGSHNFCSILCKPPSIPSSPRPTSKNLILIHHVWRIWPQQ